MKGSHAAYWHWNAFCRFWRVLAAAMRNPDGYKSAVQSRERHLAEADIATKAWRGGTVDELITYAMWELEECMQSLNPEPQLRGDVDDAFHAGCCALRASAALYRLRRLLRAAKVRE